MGKKLLYQSLIPPSLCTKTLTSKEGPTIDKQFLKMGRYLSFPSIDALSTLVSDYIHITVASIYLLNVSRFPGA